MLRLGLFASALLLSLQSLAFGPTAAGAFDVPSRGLAVPSVDQGRELAPQRLRLATSRTRRPALGVQFHGTWGHYTSEKRAKVLERIRRSGATWVRLDVGWSMIQPDAGSYDLDWGVPHVGQVIRQVHRHGLKLLVMFWQTPEWAREGGTVRSTPSDPGTYAEALSWAAARWGHRVDAWQVWNEPNNPDFLTGADPADYVRLLCPAYAALQGNDPHTKVVFGGTSYNDDAWIRRAYEAGAKDCFDVMATHPYMAPSDAPPETADDGDIWNLRHVRAVRAVMEDFGDAGPIWATEFGWSSHANTGTEDPWDRGVSRTAQAEYAVRALRLLRNEYPYVRKAFWYNEHDKSTGDPQQDGYGLLTRDLRAKPVHQALRNYYS